MISSLFGGQVTTDLVLDVHGRKSAPLNRNSGGERVPIFAEGEEVSGGATISIRPDRTFDHQGIRLEFIGHLEMKTDKTKSLDFLKVSKDLAPPGPLLESKEFRWKFGIIDTPCESYWGTNVTVRYFVRFTVQRQYASSIVKEADILIQHVCPTKPTMPEDYQLKMEVGIEGCLHISFLFGKGCFHLKDVIQGHVHFSTSRLKLKTMELVLVRNENIKSASGKTVTDSHNVTKFELMDGCPLRNETIPVRMHLSGQDLTPTLTDVLDRFSVKYSINLVLIDEEERRYFKKQEIFLYRKRLG